MKNKYFFPILLMTFVYAFMCLSCGKTVDNIPTTITEQTTINTATITETRSESITSTTVSDTTTSKYQTQIISTVQTTSTTVYKPYTEEAFSIISSNTVSAAETQIPSTAEPESSCETTPEKTYYEFASFNDYTEWANSIGYPNGSLTPCGVYGINQDYYHTKPDFAGYNSGRIVIGDSRCCQLGIYQERSGSSDFATFAVWGGHYVSGYGGIVTDEYFSDIKQCFESQIKCCKKCDIYLFATVNDYDYRSNANSTSIYAALNTANNLASMSYEADGISYHPRVIIIGFDGCWTNGDLFGIPQENFNRYVSDYNTELYKALLSYELLSSNASYFSTVPDIADGKAAFIDDGLHYADNTLESIRRFIISIP